MTEAMCANKEVFVPNDDKQRVLYTGQNFFCLFWSLQNMSKYGFNLIILNVHQDVKNVLAIVKVQQFFYLWYFRNFK